MTKSKSGKADISPEVFDKWFGRLLEIEEEVDSLEDAEKQFRQEIVSELGTKMAEKFSTKLLQSLLPPPGKEALKRDREQVFKRAILSVYKSDSIEITEPPQKDSDGVIRARFKDSSSQKVFEGMLTMQGKKWIPSYSPLDEKE